VQDMQHSNLHGFVTEVTYMFLWNKQTNKPALFARIPPNECFSQLKMMIDRK
jgi:hypothetical protein